MKTSWTKGMNAQQKDEMILAFQGAGFLRERTIALLQEKITSANKKRISEEGYASPSWAYQQADASGYIRALEEIISLLE